MRGRLRPTTIRLVAVALGAGALFALPRMPSARADPTCTYDPSRGSVDVVLGVDDTAILSIGSEGEILLGVDPCGAATTTNTTSFSVLGDTGSETLVVQGDEAARFPQDFPFVVDLVSGPRDLVRVVLADTTAQTVTVGPEGIDFGGDGSVDMETFNLDRIEVDGGDGNDTFTTTSGADAGPLQIPVAFSGGDGADTLTGSDTAGDELYGDTGADTLEGAGGADLLNGGDDSDRDTCIADPSDTVQACDLVLGAVSPTTVSPTPSTVSPTQTTVSPDRSSSTGPPSTRGGHIRVSPVAGRRRLRPWIATAAVAVLLIVLPGLGYALRASRGRRLRSVRRLGATLEDGLMSVRVLEEAVPARSHVVELVPHADPGAQRVEEVDTP